ncbi:transformer-2 protein homolog beta isoform X2 [Hemiscyllium ocellatum]|uniref:transformer-2 protein homolog beta isoform X2 n=1 Tax=Hemiscyllium ocellatum TaxID=170820 RepID=UPI0029671560|nr:transformer-2 protein homolog beta isoform X2 [Hemiscyllium ocellatum]
MYTALQMGAPEWGFKHRTAAASLPTIEDKGEGVPNLSLTLMREESQDKKKIEALKDSRSPSKSPSGSPHGSGKSASQSPENSPERSRSRDGSRRSRSKSRSRSRSKSRSVSRRSSRRRYSRSRSRSRSRRRRSRSRSYSPDYRRRRSHSRSPMSNRRRHIGNRANPDPNTCLGVFGLSLYTTERDLREVFSRYGPLAGVNVVYDQQSNRSRGFSFVYFENVDDAKEAKERANGMELDGRRIRVDFSITKRAHTPTPGIYMGRPTYSSRRRDSYDRYDRYDDREYYSRSYRRRSPSPYYSRGGYRSRSRSRSYSPRRY